MEATEYLELMGWSPKEFKVEPKESIDRLKKLTNWETRVFPIRDAFGKRAFGEGSAIVNIEWMEESLKEMENIPVPPSMDISKDSGIPYPPPPLMKTEENPEEMEIGFEEIETSRDGHDVEGTEEQDGPPEMFPLDDLRFIKTRKANLALNGWKAIGNKMAKDGRELDDREILEMDNKEYIDLIRVKQEDDKAKEEETPEVFLCKNKEQRPDGPRCKSQCPYCDKVENHEVEAPPSSPLEEETISDPVDVPTDDDVEPETEAIEKEPEEISEEEKEADPDVDEFLIATPKKDILEAYWDIDNICSIMEKAKSALFCISMMENKIEKGASDKEVVELFKKLTNGKV